MALTEIYVYQLAREISREAWAVYERMTWQEKKIMGDQWITAIDSVGANIAEGYGRFHYLDKNKFNYNARGSLQEAQHWTDVLGERQKVSIEELGSYNEKIGRLMKMLNNYIAATKDRSILR